MIIVEIRNTTFPFQLEVVLNKEIFA